MNYLRFKCISICCNFLFIGLANIKDVGNWDSQMYQTNGSIVIYIFAFHVNLFKWKMSSWTPTLVRWKYWKIDCNCVFMCKYVYSFQPVLEYSWVDERHIADTYFIFVVYSYVCTLQFNHRLWIMSVSMAAMGYTL